MNDGRLRMRTGNEIVGLDSLVAKTSAVDASGALKHAPISGVTFRPTRPVAHEDGVVTEVARTVSEELDLPIVHVHLDNHATGPGPGVGAPPRLNGPPLRGPGPGVQLCFSTGAWPRPPVASSTSSGSTSAFPGCSSSRPTCTTARRTLERMRHSSSTCRPAPTTKSSRTRWTCHTIHRWLRRSCLFAGDAGTWRDRRTNWRG